MSKYGRTNAQVTRVANQQAQAHTVCFASSPNYTFTLRSGATFTGKALLYGRDWVDLPTFRGYINSLTDADYFSKTVFVSGYGDVAIADIAQLS